MTTIEVNVLKDLLGQVMVKVEKVGEGDQDELLFWFEDGRVYSFSHNQSCCETVEIESIVGDLEDLVGSPLLMAEETSSDSEDVSQFSSQTWTFYKFATLKGYVDVRWIGTSNGYYSESVDHGFLTPNRVLKYMPLKKLN